MSETFIPSPHQPRLKELIKANPYVAILVDMGGQKTSTTLWAITELIDELDVAKILVVAPKRVAKTTWPGELQRWDRFNHLTYRVIESDAFQFKRVAVTVTRKKKQTTVKKLVPQATPASFLTGEQIHTISRDNLVHLVTLLGADHWPYDLVVLDESSGFRDQSSGRFKSAKLLRKYGLIGRMVQLTGTPRPKSLLNLWAQIYLLDQGQRLGTSYTDFQDRYFVPATKGKDSRGRLQTFSWKPKEGAEEEIFAKLSDLCFSLLPEDLISLPERTFNRIVVPLAPGARQAYRTMERDSLLGLQGADAVAPNRAALVGKLLQCASGAVYDENKVAHTLHTAKLDALEEVVEAMNGAPLLVAYWFQHELDRIRERFPNAVDLNDSDDTEDRWNRGEIDMLLLNPACGAHGLNLQFNDGHGCWFSPIHDLELYLQWNKRLHRPGRKTPVVIHHLLAEDTIDEAVLDSLDPKYEGQDRLLRAVRLRLGEK